LFKLPGIGKKTAEKIVLELSDKLDDFGSVNETSNFDNDAFDALVQLGYRERDIIATLQLVSKEENMEIEQVIKTAIRMMSKN
jgi:Holliday junction DNA helicase RuvA